MTRRTAPLLLALALGLSACESQGGPPPVAPPPKATPPPPKPPVTDITAQDYVMPALPLARVTLPDAFGGKHAVQAEVAAGRNERTRGLMWRTELAEGKGMLFIFPADDYLSFWMKNTLIPLDMIFIDSGLTVVTIIERAEPKTLSSRATRAPAKYVLEVPGGWASKVGLKTGLKVQIDGIAGITVAP